MGGTPMLESIPINDDESAIPPTIPAMAPALAFPKVCLVIGSIDLVLLH